MSTVADLAKTSTKAGFNYLWGLVISVVISALGSIYVSSLLGDELYGLYSIVLIVPNMLFLFRDWGINNAMVRYTAQYRAEKREPEIRSIFVTGILFEIALGLALTLTAFFLSDFIANNIFNRPTIAPLIQIASFSILAGGIVNAATAIFTGTEETTYNSVMLICQSIIKTLLMIGLVIVGFSTQGAIIGFTAAYLIAGLIGIPFIVTLYKKIPKPFSYKLEIKEYLKEMLKYSTPISILTILTGLLAQFYATVLAAFYENNALIGTYAIAQNFIVLISFFALPITTILLPTFSKIDIKKDQTTLQSVFQSSIKYASLLVIPITALVMCLSTQAVTTVYVDKFTTAPIFFTLLAINYLLTAAGNLSISNVINSQGHTNVNLKLALLTATIGFPLGYYLIMNYHVYGLIFTSLFAPIPSLIISIIWIKKHYNLTINWASSIKILTSATITATLTYLLVNFTIFDNTTRTNSAIALTIGTLFFITTQILTLTLTKTLTTNDLTNLRNMTTGLGPITKIIHLTLNTIEKTMKKLKLT